MQHLFSSWRTEAYRLIKLGSPILVAQVAQTGMGTVDTIMAGNFSAYDLAAVAVAQSIWLPILIFFVGLFTATTTTIARYYGADNHSGIKMTAQQSLWLALFCAPLTILPLLNADLIIGHLGLQPEVSKISKDYLFYLCFGLPAANLYFALRGFTEGQSITRPIMVVSLFAFLCNIPLNYLFIFGNLGMPELGGAGCGLATAIVLWIQLLSLFFITSKHSYLRKIHVLRNFCRPQYTELRRLLSLGVPTALTSLAEVSLFSAVTLIIAPLGAEVLAANQVAISISGLTFMMPLSMGIAINIRVGMRLGANDVAGARFSSLVGISVAICFAILTLTLIILGRTYIAELYSSDPAVILSASALLVFAAIYQIPDAVQISMLSAMRAYRDTRIPLVLVLIAYWVISVPLGWCLTWGAPGISPIGAKGMWIGLVCGLSCAAIMQSLRFRRVLSKSHKDNQRISLL